jgi:hypothetical protein
MSAVEVEREIEHLDFDVPCARKCFGCTNVGEVVSVVISPECPTYNGLRWLMCEECSTRSGFCNHCGAPSRYEPVA